MHKLRQLVLGSLAFFPLKCWHVTMEISQYSYVLASSVPDLYYCSAPGFPDCQPGHVVIKTFAGCQWA